MLKNFLFYVSQISKNYATKASTYFILLIYKVFSLVITDQLFIFEHHFTSPPRWKIMRIRQMSPDLYRYLQTKATRMYKLYTIRLTWWREHLQYQLNSILRGNLSIRLETAGTLLISVRTFIEMNRLIVFRLLSNILIGTKYLSTYNNIQL